MSPFVSDATVTDLGRLANNFARRFNVIAEKHGFDLPMEVLIPLVEMFFEALSSPPPEPGERT